MEFTGFMAPDDLRSWGTALTVVVLAVNAFLRLAPASWGQWSKLVGMVAAQALVFAVRGLPVDAAGWMTTIANGLALFLAAAGGSHLTAGLADATLGDALHYRIDRPRRFWVRW